MNIRQIALRILDEYEAGGKFINLALSSHIADGLSAEDRAALTALLYTTVERKLSYDYYICSLSRRSDSDIDPHTKNLLRLGLCQIIDMHSIPDYAAVNETVKLSKKAGERSFVNGVLREAVRRKGDLPMPPEDKAARYISVKYSFPLSTVRHFDSLYGREDTERLLDFFNTVKYTDLTVNTNKISVEDYRNMLSSVGIESETNSLAPISIRLWGSYNPERLPGFSKGYFFVQDRASAISAEALGAITEGVIIDTCSAPGGKSFAAAISCADSSTIYAFDIHDSKLSLITSGAERLGIKNIIVSARDAIDPDRKLYGMADKVICDAPCSGLGVLGKKPDLRYKDIGDGKSLTALQLEILTASAKYLKEGGEMIYSTCTLNPLENERVVEAFLCDNPEFDLVPFTVGDMTVDSGMLTLLPHVHVTDGFFMAKIKRKI